MTVDQILEQVKVVLIGEAFPPESVARCNRSVEEAY